MAHIVSMSIFLYAMFNFECVHSLQRCKQQPFYSGLDYIQQVCAYQVRKMSLIKNLFQLNQFSLQKKLSLCPKAACALDVDLHISLHCWADQAGKNKWNTEILPGLERARQV